MASETLGVLDIQVKIDWKKINRSFENIRKKSSSVGDKLKRGFGGALSSLVGIARTVTVNIARLFTSAFTSILNVIKKTMIVAGAAITGLYVLSIKNAVAQEEAEGSLADALEVNNELTKERIKQLKDFASATQTATIYGDEQILQIMALQKRLGVANQELEHSAEMTIGLAAATGRNIDTMAQYVAMAKQGEFTMLRRYIPALRTTTDETEQMAIVTEFANNGFKIAQGQIKRTSGSFKQLKNILGDLTELIGTPFLERITKNNKALKEFASRKDVQDTLTKISQLVADKVLKAFDKLRAVITSKDFIVKFTKLLNDTIDVLKIVFKETKKVAKVFYEWVTNKKRVEEFKNTLNSVWLSLNSFFVIIHHLQKSFDNLNKMLGFSKGSVADLISRFIQMSFFIKAVQYSLTQWFFKAHKGNVAVGKHIKVLGLLIKTLGFVKTAFISVATGMWTLVTKTIPAVIANFGTLVAAIPGWIAGLTALKVAVLALKIALVAGGIALAAVIGWKIGKWAYDNISGVSKLSDALAWLIIQMTKIINLIPGINIGGVGTFGNDKGKGPKITPEIQDYKDQLAAKRAKLESPPMSSLGQTSVASPRAVATANQGRGMSEGDKAIVEEIRNLRKDTKEIPQKQQLLAQNYSA